MSHANSIDYNIGSQYNVKFWCQFNEIFWFNRISQKQLVNETEQEEHEGEYINAFDFLNNF